MKNSEWQWTIQIRGTLSDLEHLARHFTETELRIFQDGQDKIYLCQSKSFDTCQTSKEVQAIAEEELAVLSGVLRIARSSSEPLTFGSVLKLHGDGRREVFVHLEAVQIGAEIGEPTITFLDAQGNLIQIPTPPPRTVILRSLASKDPAVTKVLRLVAAPDARTWVGLYRLYEVIEADTISISSGKHSQRQNIWGSRDDLRRFKHSANSVNVAGDSARHGKEPHKPPRNPMTIEEAIAYINYIINAWLASKGA